MYYAGAKNYPSLPEMSGRCVKPVKLQDISRRSRLQMLYIMRHELDPEKTDNIVNVFITVFKIVDLTLSHLTVGAKMRLRDFEDSLQIFTAQQIAADFIVTRNIRDFKDSKIPALTPEELLEKIE